MKQTNLTDIIREQIIYDTLDKFAESYKIALSSFRRDRTDLETYRWLGNVCRETKDAQKYINYYDDNKRK